MIALGYVTSSEQWATSSPNRVDHAGHNPIPFHPLFSHCVTPLSPSIHAFTVKTDQHFTAGPPGQLSGIDTTRQAVASLQGYAYQLVATALAWVDIDERSRIYLEVAEDYLTVVDQAFRTVQVKHSGKTSSVTLNSIGVLNAISNFVHLTQHNPHHHLELHYLTTSIIGLERKKSDRINGRPALIYWQDMLVGRTVRPLRQRLLRSKLPAQVRDYLSSLNESDFHDKIIARIHWQCGQPDIVDLRTELERRVIVLGREIFHLPAQDAFRLCDSLIFYILQKCILPDASNRYLTRADLYNEIDRVTQTTIPRSTANLLAHLPFTNLLSTFGSESDVSPILHIEPTWLLEGTSIPTHQRLVIRELIHSKLVQFLTDYKHAILIGASGLGKSTLSNHAASVRDMRYFLVDFRDVETSEAKSRLEWFLARIESMAPCLVIFEDLNILHDRRIALTLKRVVATLRRHECEFIITCYTKPTNVSLSELGLSTKSVVECTYFSQEETCTLVANYGGSTGIWGRVAYLAGSNGHPLLTHAFISGRAADNWKVSDSDDLFRYILSASEVAAVRDETRRTLLSFLPKHSRQLLYRLSFIIGKFNRQLAIELGQTLSVIPLSGESFDALVGSLVEVLGLDVYRISPLASNFGREILAQGDQRIVHRSIASHMTSKRTINALDVDVIVLHSLLGNYSKGLAIAALGILSASTDNIEQYAEYMPTLRLLKTNAPLQIEDKYVSALIRLAQFKLTVAHGDVDRASDIADRIFDELARVPEGEAKSVLESTVVLTILCNVGVANILDNWVHLLVRAKDILNGEVFRNFVKPRTQDKFDPSDLCHLGALFGIGAANIQSVSRLEGIIDDLDYVETTARREMLSPLDSSLDDHSGFIGASWVAELEAGTLNADEAALRYGRMAAKTQTWDLPLLSSQCSIAQSVMLDEYLHDGDSALSVLHEAQVALGPQAPLVHALVKIHWRNGKYDSALQLFSESECLPRLANPVDAAFAFRIGAICAARCAEWVRAEKWFHTAQNHATLADTDEMTVMAVGLGADAAICAFKANDTERAILGLIRSVEALVTMNADQSVRSAYCHRVIRHALLWVNAQIQCTEMLDSDGFPLVMEVGMCSNPQPPPAVVEQPLSSLDIAWYMLAEIEVGTRLNLGINTGLDRHITGGPIPLMDASLRIRKFQNYIDQLDVDKFVTNFMEYIEGAHYVLTAMSNVEAQKKPLDSVRGMVPAIDLQGPLDYHVGRIGKNAVICYALQSVFEGSVSSISELNYALSVAFSGSFPGHQVLEYWSGQNGELEELERTVIGLVKKILNTNILSRGIFLFPALNSLNGAISLSIKISWPCASRNGRE